MQTKEGLKAIRSANQIKVANTAPAVPGPQGQNPEPNPVPMITGQKGGRFIVATKVVNFILNIAVYVQKKLFNQKSFLKTVAFCYKLVTLHTILKIFKRFLYCYEW
jgi:hypothetical protein